MKYWRATGSEDDATTDNVTTTTYTATGLDTNTVYTFRVASYTEEGIGVYSEPVNISTIPTGEYIIKYKFISNRHLIAIIMVNTQYIFIIQSSMHACMMMQVCMHHHHLT